jgi:hypothetical protein
MYFNRKNSEENQLNVHYIFQLASFYNGIKLPDASDLKSLKYQYEHSLKKKEYDKSIESALQIAAYHTPIGFLLYVDTKLASLKQQLKTGEIIEQESFGLLTLVFFLTLLYGHLSNTKEFTALLIELTGNSEWRKYLESTKGELLTLVQIPFKKIEEAALSAEELFKKYKVETATTSSLTRR